MLEKNIETEFTIKEKKQKTGVQAKKFLIMNTLNQVHEFNVKNKFFRLEPMNKENDRIIVDQQIVDHPDFITQYGYVSVREVK